MFLDLKIKFIEKIFKIIIFLPIISFFLGFYFNENSAGAGGYQGDISWIKSNINIFLENNILKATLHPDFFGNRTPLIYILQKIFNPFFGNYEMYRITSFLISLIGPIIFYQLLKEKFYSVEKEILFLIASLIYLSPYYRTSAYWGLNENYGIITTITSFYYLFKVFEASKFKLSNLFLLIIFSSLSVYFDLKLAFVPLLSFLIILFSKYNYKLKLFVFFGYAILSIPYLLLIIYWGGLVPVKTQYFNTNTITSFEDLNKLYFIHIGYAATLIGFYILPIVLFTTKDILNSLKSMWLRKESKYFLILVGIFIIYHFCFFDFKKFTITDYWIGLGIVHKFSNIVTNKIIYREIITYVFFFFSFMLILYYYFLNKINLIYLSYFLFISLLLWPLMQEYFDPIILIVAFSLFKSLKYFNKKNTFIIFLYYSFFLIIANIYYF